jgi:hypothetical protein
MITPGSASTPTAHSGRPRAKTSERGSVSMPLLLAAVLSLVVFVWMANLSVYLYGRGVMRMAAEEGARAGSRASVPSVQACQERAGQILSNLLGGSLGREVTLSCEEAGGVMRSRVRARFEGWLPPVPDVRPQVSAVVIKEQGR